MARFYFLSLALLLALIKDGSASIALNANCGATDTCTDTTATCDPTAKKCLIKDGESCSSNPTYCVTGASCSSGTCSCASVYIADATDKFCSPKDTQVGGTCTSTCAAANAECTGDAAKTCKCKTGYTVKYSDLSCSGAGNILGSLIVFMASVLLSLRIG